MGVLPTLLIEVSPRLPPEFVKPNHQGKILPGITGNIQLKDFEIELMIEEDVWIQTGLWLPVGAKGVMKCDNFYPDVYVQIGSHTESLVNCAPPWKRWPHVISILPLTESLVIVASPFGGIVYFVLEMGAFFLPSRLVFQFEGFSQYPRIQFGNRPKILTCHGESSI
jgi:hypothetical protein